MRWPLRNQILVPLVTVVLVGLVAVSGMNAYLSARRIEESIEGQLLQVSQMLVRSNFPLTPGVLRQMRDLAGAEFVRVDEEHRVLAASTRFARSPHLPSAAPLDQHGLLRHILRVDGSAYYHGTVAFPSGADPARRGSLHVLYPVARYQRAWRDAVFSPLAIGAVAILLVSGLSLVVAGRVTQPLARLRRQVERIATGDFRALPVPARNDEIADLSRAVNRMAEMLARYEDQVRRREQLRTLDQLGGGIAHQLRNSVTGCRLAIELHGRECSQPGETLDVASRQLDLMETFLQRFLSLGGEPATPHSHVDLREVVDNVTRLVAPTARHVAVTVEWDVPDREHIVHGDAGALEQLLVNLVLNGVEAAAQAATADAAAAGRVEVSLAAVNDRVQLIVEDTGRGPAAEVREKLFEPFVTEKPDGTGLGLAVVREVAGAHGGDVRWTREGEKTRFLVELPSASKTIAPTQFEPVAGGCETSRAEG